MLRSFSKTDNDRKLQSKGNHERLSSLTDTNRKRAGSPVSLFEAAERAKTSISRNTNKRRQTLRIHAERTPPHSSQPSSSLRSRKAVTAREQEENEGGLRGLEQAVQQQLIHGSDLALQQETPLTYSPQLGPRSEESAGPANPTPLDSQDDLNMENYSPSPSSGSPRSYASTPRTMRTPPPPAQNGETAPAQIFIHSTELTGPTSDQLPSLPSPSLSPVTAALTGGASSYFPSIHSATTSFDAEIPDMEGNSLAESSMSLYRRPLRPQATNVMEIPSMLDSFDAMPPQLKDYVMYQLLRRCNKANLKFVAEVVNPTLKCDFIARLPTELSLCVLRYLDVKSLCRAAQVSKKWRTVVDTDDPTWRRRLELDGYTIPSGEIERAIREGWGYQVPQNKWDWERDLAEYFADLRASKKPRPPSSSSSLSSARPKRAAFTRAAARQSQQQREQSRRARRDLQQDEQDLFSRRKEQQRQSGESESALQNLGEEELRDVVAGIVSGELDLGITPEQAASLPDEVAGLKSLRNYHLFKAIYRRNHLIRAGWSRPEIKPKHISFRGHPDHVITCLQFDSDKILTGSDDTNINVYDTKTGAIKNTLVGHEGGVWALEYEGNTLVSGSTDRTVRVWNIESGECTQVFMGHTSTVRCLKILKPTKVGNKMMPPEPLIITGSRDSTVRIWKLPKPTDRPYIPPRGSETTVTSHALTALMNSNPYYVRTLSNHTNSVRTIDCHGDTLVSGSYDYSVRVWKISTGECVHRLIGHTNKVYSVVLDHERNRCISGSMDSLVKVWSLSTGQPIFTLQGHSALVGLLDLSHDWLVSAAADATLRIWDPDTGHCKHILRSHQTAITCFQHDGHKVVSGSDGTLKMFDLKSGRFIRDLLTDLNLVWQVKFNERQCVAAVQRRGGVYIEVSCIL